MADVALRGSLIERLKADPQLSGSLTKCNGQLILNIPKENIRSTLSHLKSTPGLDFDYFSFVTAVDMFPRKPRFDLIYNLYSVLHDHWLRVKVPVEDGEEVDTVSDIYKGANWHEREVYDLFGIKFKNHPDLRRILTSDNWYGHPLRKEYSHIGEPAWALGTNVLQNIAEAGIVRRESGKLEAEPTKTIILNMGPQHPATHGVLRLALELEGERIVDCVPHIGYLHTGIEKLSEHHNWTQNVTHYSRMDYGAPMNNEFAYCLAVEKLIPDLDVPKRAQYIRVLMSELTRIISHLLWLATHALDIGAQSIFLYCFAEREKILDLYEMIGGQRMMTSYIRIGGCALDMPKEFPDAVRSWAKDFLQNVQIYEDILTKNPIWKERTVGVGVIDAETAKSYGVSGPIARGSGINWDLRKGASYSSYEEFDFDVPVFDGCDVYSRYLVRMEEMRQSYRIILQALDKIADTEPGTYLSKNYKYAPPRREDINSSIEELIHHFKYWTEGIWVPPGEAYAYIEGSKGELGFFCVSDGSAHPVRVKVRGSSFSNLSAIAEMVKGHLVADVVAIIGSIDIILGEVDR